MENKVLLNTFDASSFNKGAGAIKQALWLLVNACLFKSSWFVFTGIKVALLKLFGAKIGKGLVLKPSVSIKFPWKLIVGDYCWIGEHVWIDNLDQVIIGHHVCISQGAFLLTGNHDYTRASFDYRNAPIVLEDGVWIGAKAVVCPGVVCKSHAILAVGSVATKSLQPFTVYQGNPAVEVRKRIIKNG